MFSVHNFRQAHLPTTPGLRQLLRRAQTYSHLLLHPCSLLDSPLGTGQVPITQPNQKLMIM